MEIERGAGIYLGCGENFRVGKPAMLVVVFFLFFF